MEIRVLRSSMSGYQLPVEQAMLDAGRSAGICQARDSYDRIEAWTNEHAMNVYHSTAESGHHSVDGHDSYSLLLSGVPKIIAMVLNNERDCNTSEKSARYTVMPTEGEEKRLYEKWFALFFEAIRGAYLQIDDEVAKKLAQENARYFISVFTPATIMEYTVDFRQGNYLIQFMEEFTGEGLAIPRDFVEKLKPWLHETAKLLRPILNADELRDHKGRSLSMFGKRERYEHFHESYSVNYWGSFSHMAQAHRHRTIAYEMMIPELSDAKFFVPPIIADMPEVVEQYLADMESIKANYPQGMLVRINEQGRHDEFVTSKCTERLCGAAQLEICLQTKKTLDRYIAAVAEQGLTHVYNDLLPVQNKTKCQMEFMNQKCTRPCPLGPALAFDRKI